MKPCAFSGPLPGMAVDILDERGSSLLGKPGEVGELSIRAPWIGMTRGFWRDEADERYRETYWSRFENVWVHGDWAATDEDGLWYILGRSDDTIKIAGKRLGPAEAESVLVSHPAVKEAAAIGVPDEAKGQALVCFCILRNAAGEDDLKKLKSDLSTLIARDLGKPMAPKEILFVPDLPRTRNAKIMRRVVRAAYLGKDAGDLSALENPQAVEAVRTAARAS
jgi:acetyl-CoA synthetase